MIPNVRGPRTKRGGGSLQGQGGVGGCGEGRAGLATTPLEGRTQGLTVPRNYPRPSFPRREGTREPPLLSAPR